MATPAVTPTQPPLHQVLPADATSPSLVRRALRAWLGDLRLSLDDTADLVLAVHEAVENVVEHAYVSVPDSGEVRIEVEVRTVRDDSARVVATVTDQGRWRPVPDDSGYRGRGMQIMRSCTDFLHVNTSERGTTITLASRPF
jgi:serine/threonine-protein kinase RsbW